MVTSINGNNVTWRDSKTGNLITDVHQDLEKVMAYNRPINNSSGNQTDRKRSHKRRRKVRKPTKGRGQAQQSGGYLSGPSHEQGGIAAQIPGQDPIELEGGEYIINAQTVDALGTPFLDELNSTQTSYHQGGYQQGQLPSPSNYRRGGKVGRNKMTRGGGVPGNSGGGSRDCPSDEVELWGVCYDPVTTTGILMSGEGLTGTIPNEIGYLTNLTNLSISNNYLTGGIPSWIGNLPNLERLFLHNNQLTGPIPSSIGNLTNLEYLNFGGNDFTGTLPPEIGNLTNLQWLYFNGNQLTGQIPQEVCELIYNNNLQTLSSTGGSIGNNFTYACHGDANADGNYNILDVVTTIQHIIGNTELDEYTSWLADMNFDGNVNVGDIVAMVNQLLSTPNLSSGDRTQLQQILNQVQSGHVQSGQVGQQMTRRTRQKMTRQRSGRPTRKRRGGSTKRPAKAMRRGGSTKRPAKRMMHGGVHNSGGGIVNTPSGNHTSFPGGNGIVGGTINPLSAPSIQLQLQQGGRPSTRRMQQGGHTHNLPAHTHPLLVDGWGRLGPQHEMFATSSMPDNYNSGVQGGSAGYVYNTGHARTPQAGGFEVPWPIAQINPEPWMFNQNMFGDGDWLNSGGDDGGPHNHPGRPRQQMTRRRGGRARGRR